MRRFKLTGVALLAVFALGAVAATAAQAEEAPYWSIEGTRLAAGKTSEVTAKAVGTVTLTAATGVVKCKALKVKAGAVLLGSTAGEPGKNDETVELTECQQEKNGSEEPTCKIVGDKVTTEPLTAELAYAENKKSLVGEITPASGKTLAIVHYEGSGCTATEISVKGVAVVQGWTDSGGVAGELVELGKTVTQAESWILKLTGTSKTKIWLIKGGTGASVEDETTYAGTEATLGGEILTLLATNGVSNKKLWSALL
jgi:predicted TIM-barrel enzyme